MEITKTAMRFPTPGLYAQYLTTLETKDIFRMVNCDHYRKSLPEEYLDMLYFEIQDRMEVASWRTFYDYE